MRELIKLIENFSKEPLMEAGEVAKPNVNNAPAARRNTLPGRRGVEVPALAATADQMGQLSHHMAQIDDHEYYGDNPTDAIPIPERTGNDLVMAVNNAVVEQGITPPTWYSVATLPNAMMKMGIQRLGRDLFGGFTDTPIDQINVLASPVNARDVQVMAKWIQENGTMVDGDVHIDFSRIMPGYDAEISLWKAEGCEFMLVRDFMGNYIYGWVDNSQGAIDSTPGHELLETRKINESANIRSHPEFSLLVTILERYGKEGPEEGTVDFIMAETYAKGLARETGIKASSILKEAYVSIFDRPNAAESGHDRRQAKRRARIRELEREIARRQAEETRENPTPLGEIKPDTKPTTLDKAEIDSTPRLVAMSESRQDDIAHIMSHVQQPSANPWGISFSVDESAEYTDSNIETDEPEIEEPEEIVEETINEEEISKFYAISEDTTEAGVEVWSDGEVCVHSLGGEFIVYVNNVEQKRFPDRDAAIAWGEYLRSGDNDMPVSRGNQQVSEEIQDEAILAEAAKFAILAGIGAKPKAVERTGEIADIMALAGIRR